MATGAGHGQRPHPARADVRHGRRQPGEHGLGLAADQVGEGRCHAPVGNMHHEAVDLLLEQLHGQVRQRASAGRPVAELARVLAQVVGKFFQGARWQAAVDHQHIGRAADHADGREVFDRVIGQLAGGRAGAVGGDIALQQGVAIGRCFGRDLAGDHAAAASLVVDQKGLVQQLAPALGHGAAHHIAAAAGCYGHDVANGLVRVGGLGQQQGRAAQQAGASAQNESTFHGYPSFKDRQRAASHPGGGCGLSLCRHQQNHQGAGPAVSRFGLHKSQHFLFLYQPAVHPAFQNGGFAG